METPSKLLTLRETADLLGISLWTLYRWSSKRQIETVRLGGRVMVKPESLARMISENTRPAVTA